MANIHYDGYYNLKKKTESNKNLQEYGENETPIHAGEMGKDVVATVENNLAVPQKVQQRDVI